jgi:hypothetical protein
MLHKRKNVDFAETGFTRSSVGIVTKLWAGREGGGGEVDSSLVHSVQTDSGANPPTYPMGSVSSFPEGKTAGSWSWPLASI